MLRRSVSKDGKSRAFINDHPVSVSLLKQAGEMLVEIHGQFDTQTLLNPRVHRGMLDEYAGAKVEELAAVWKDWKEAIEAFEKKKQDMARAKSDEAYFRAALEQLDELSPKAGEEESLTLLRSRLMKRELEK